MKPCHFCGRDESEGRCVPQCDRYHGTDCNRRADVEDGICICPDSRVYRTDELKPEPSSRTLTRSVEDDDSEAFLAAGLIDGIYVAAKFEPALTEIQRREVQAALAIADDLADAVPGAGGVRFPGKTDLAVLVNAAIAVLTIAKRATHLSTDRRGQLLATGRKQLLMAREWQKS